ncbi:DUF6289 family protein [Pyxidicoccus xibeiensis]|uniref:DUF6289 family protein n=1 Tax=Pyxidicoccus xibeiensis TaxID=2906759 RepID=UPI0020A77FFA|nr:DUF6289 family protein [Pyxidicoccus xibeiensis]MCP3144321.1 DUF6289 family protein [Pyxidicoccus xibeiensis]
MMLSRWVVGLSALLAVACGGPVEQESEEVEPAAAVSTVEQQQVEPGGDVRYGQHRTYYSNAAKTTWVGAWHYDCAGYITQSGQVTPYYTDISFICS